ncbi:MAG: hypothetical protein U9R21_04725 [Candidatus Thermoplasmatota archaeon]|nr:hypothetical protein [Candidatus Thermoplasmatota archaeon]
MKEVAIYEPDNLNAKWKDILKDSELYKALVTNEEFERWNHISKTTLRKLLGDSFSKKVKNVKERVDKAEEYLINFVTDAGLFISDGDCLRLVKEMEGKIPQKKKEEKASIGEVTIEEPLGEESMITPSKGLTYIKDDDFELKIKLNDLSLKLLEKQIEVLKIKLESMHNKQRNGGNDVEE